MSGIRVIKSQSLGVDGRLRGGEKKRSKEVTGVRDGLHQYCCWMVKVQANWPSLLRAGEECDWEGTHVGSGSVSNDS